MNPFLRKTLTRAGEALIRRTLRRGMARVLMAVAVAGSATTYVGGSGALSWLGSAVAQSASLFATDGGGKGVGFANCRKFFAHGVAPAAPAGSQLRELCFGTFAVLHSGATKTPVYVAERLSRDTLLAARRQHRSDRFFADARLPQRERAELDDYRRSGYSRGHMAPAADMPSEEAMAQSFSLANIVPQDPAQNAGAWAKIEQDTRRYVMRARGDVFVITGPVFDGAPRTIGAGRVAVPSHLFKLVYDPASGRSWAHWQANSPDAQVGRPITYRELVQRTGLELLPGLAAQSKAADSAGLWRNP